MLGCRWVMFLRTILAVNTPIREAKANATRQTLNLILTKSQERT